MLSRRTLIGKAAVGAVAALAVGAAGGVGQAATRPRRAGATPGAEPAEVPAEAFGPAEASAESAAEVVARAPQAPAPWALVAPLVAGVEVAHGWTLVDLTPVQDGSAVVTLQNGRGHAQRIHLCANDGTPQGLVFTRRVDLVVMNQGYGELPTDEPLGQAVAAVAHAIAANEGRVADEVFATLLPHRERVERFAAANDVATDGRLR